MLIEPTRRKLITGLVSLIAAPAIVRASSLMPVKAMVSTVDDFEFYTDNLRVMLDIRYSMAMYGRAFVKYRESEPPILLGLHDYTLEETPGGYALRGRPASFPARPSTAAG